MVFSEHFSLCLTVKDATTAARKNEIIADDPTSFTARPESVNMPAAIIVPTPIANAVGNPSSR